MSTTPTRVGPALVLTWSAPAAAPVGLTDALLAEIDRDPSTLVVLDLHDVDLATADTARAVLAFAQASAARGVPCVLVGPESALLANADPTASVPRFATLDQALAEHAGTGGSEQLLELFESLTRTLFSATTVVGALELIVAAAVRAVPGADLVSVTLRAPDGAFYTPVQTNGTATVLDQVQYATGLGPCTDAALPDGPGYVSSTDLSTETRWPDFATAAAGHGFRTILATELAVPGEPSGALNIYSRSPHGLTADDRHAALLLATHGSLALAHARSTELADLQEAQLSRALDTRDVIGQAKGILMNRQGISGDDAFELLRRTSQDLNVKLVDLARTLTSRHGELDHP